MKPHRIAALAGVLALSPLLASAATAPTVHDEQQMTQLGSHLLQDADSADKALLAHDDAAADADINDAMSIRTKMAQTAKADGESMTVPLYADLDDTEYLSTIGKTGAHPAPASADHATAATSPAPVTVKANVGQITYLAVDLDKTNSRLEAAKVAIRNKNDQAAEDTLAAIGSNLVETSVSTDLPLLTAREDLALARTALNAKNNAAAATDLRQASQALKAYAQSGAHSAEAQKLSAEIDGTSAKTASPSSVSTNTVDSWWQQVKSWFAHPTV